MVKVSEEVGTVPSDQLPATFQRLLTAPIQVLGEAALTVTSNTLLATAPVQSAEQLTLAKRLNHVVWVNALDVYVVALLEAISAKPVLLLVVDDCHLYSNVPVSPLAAALLVNAAGVNGFVPLCADAIVPPEVGLVQFVTVISNTLLATAPVQSAEQLTLAKRLNHVVWVNEPAV